MNMINKIAVTMSVLLISPLVLANEEDDMAEMQRQMNAETMSQPFYAEQPEKVDAYIKEAMKKGIKPQVYKGKN